MGSYRDGVNFSHVSTGNGAHRVAKLLRIVSRNIPSDWRRRVSARALRPRGTPADAAERTWQVALSALDAEIATSRSFASASAGPAAAPKPLYALVSAGCTLNGPSFISAFHQPPHSQPNTPRRILTQANNSPSSAARSPRISTSRAPHPPPAPPGCDGVRRVALCVFGLAFWPSEE